ncbi:DUF6011 domain-containing protein [Streptomyces iakyrus]|uniref:DUF6011 domain-containing protein n=1 Tax=Streptomyces iakyrus TaxID=68219 RepID=UPI0036978548
MPRRKCEGGCGRWLKSPAAVALGYGRVCAERLGITTPSRRTATTNRPTESAVEVHPDQAALPLHYHQPTLESL